jgi:hypothetical protein
MNTENFVKIANLINLFNEQNKKQPGHKTFVHIDSMDEFQKKENGAVCALNFTANGFGGEQKSTLEFVSGEQLLTYLTIHTK